MINFKSLENKIDWTTTLVPFCIVLALMTVFILLPEESKYLLIKLEDSSETLEVYIMLFLALEC